MKQPLTQKEFELFKDVDFVLDLAKLTFNPQTVEAIKNLRISYLIDKANNNALAYLANPEALVQSQIRADIGIEILTHLLEVNTTNQQQLKEDEDASE